MKKSQEEITPITRKISYEDFVSMMEVPLQKSNKKFDHAANQHLIGRILRSDTQIFLNCNEHASHNFSVCVRNVDGNTRCKFCPRHVEYEKSFGFIEKEINTRGVYIDHSKNKEKGININRISISSAAKCNFYCLKSETHVWEARIADVSNGYGCPCCGQSRKIVKDNNYEYLFCLKNRNISIDIEKNLIDKIDMSKFGKGTKNLCNFMCNKNPLHRWKVAAQNNFNKTDGCPFCYGEKVLKECSFLSTEKIFNKRNVYIDYHKNEIEKINPAEIKISSEKYCNFYCSKCGNKWKSQVCLITRGASCKKCISLQSKGETQWLDILQITERYVYLDIEDKKRKRSVDGFDSKEKIVYEFHGDYWHGNPNKFNSFDYNQKCKKTFGQLYEKTLNKMILIKNKGYKVVFIWENDFNKMIKLSNNNENVLNDLVLEHAYHQIINQ